MLVSVYFRLYVLKYELLLLRVRCQHPQVLVLLHLDHLDEGLADVPILSCDLLAGVEGLHSAPLLLKLHVHLPDAVDGVRFLPDHLEVGLLLEA